MEHSLPDGACSVEWCREDKAHTRHEATLHTWHGQDVDRPHPRRELQLVLFAEQPPGPLAIKPELAMVISGPDMARPDRVRVTLTRLEWAEVAAGLRAALTMGG